MGVTKFKMPGGFFRPALLLCFIVKQQCPKGVL